MLQILLIGPALHAVSGISTHQNQLFNSELSVRFELLHFQVGGPGLKENSFQKLFRLVSNPVVFFVFLLRHRSAIVHLNTSMNHNCFWRDNVYLLIACILRRKVVCQFHGGVLPENLFPGNKLLTSLLRYLMKLPDVVVVVARLHLDAYRRFLSGQRLELVPNAIDTSSLVAESLAAKPLGHLHMVYLGRIAENKGVFEVLDAIAMLVEQGRDLRLTIGGSGPDEERLQAKVMALGLTERVDFVGPIFGEARDRLWRSCHVFVFPTYHWEGLPYALLEGMAAGAIPITTRVAGIPDVVQDGVHGLFVEAKDPVELARAIIRLDDDRVLLYRMAQTGRMRVLEHYSLGCMADHFASIYELLGGKE